MLKIDNLKTLEGKIKRYITRIIIPISGMAIVKQNNINVGHILKGCKYNERN